jgi:LPS export ABC transporter permease LptG/LPS export ABC transporter permease LptF
VRIFTRYILREVIGYALLGGVLFTFILFMRYLLPLLELAVRGIASPLDLLRLIGYLLPNFLPMTIPMAVLIGILLGLSRLASDSEVTAMRASGLGITSFLRIVSIVAALSWIASLAISLYVAPRAARALLNYEEQSKTSQATVEVQPRVFYEDFKNYVLYTQDVLPGANGTAIWKHVFLADLSQPATPHIISAQQAIVQAGSGHQTLRLDLFNGSRHDIAANDPAQYDIATFNSTVLPIETSSQEDTHLSRRDTPMQALDTSTVWRRAHGSDAVSSRPYDIEFHRRLSFPTACLVLMLVGVPLGLSSKRGGKGSGFAVTLLLVFLYYSLSEIGVALAHQQKVPAFAGVWGANILFAGAGILLIQQISRGGFALNALSGIGNAFAKGFDRLLRIRPSEPGVVGGGDRLRRLRRTVRSRFPLILDEYAMGSFLQNFFLVLCSLTVLFIIFTFFELIGDIIKYRTPLVTVGDYLINLIPFILYNVTPLCSLVAVLVTFGALSRTSEITAMKATGVSLYRIVTPVLLVAAILSALLFAFDESYLPAANRRQEALLSSIKGKPAQTFLRPDRKWISGQTGNSSSAEPTRIFYYQAFDSGRNIFANITVFEFQPGSFTLSRRIYAESAHWDSSADHWDFENGWDRSFANGDTVTSYRKFQQASFAEIHETPIYFKKEERPSQEMSYSELASYIRDLQQSGFDTTPLRVQLNRKLSWPVMTLVMAILAVPFSLSAGKRGSLAGIGAALALAIGYWVLAGVSENLGNVNSLPAVLAAWSPDLLFAMAGSYLLLRTPT